MPEAGMEDKISFGEARDSLPEFMTTLESVNNVTMCERG